MSITWKYQVFWCKIELTIVFCAGLSPDLQSMEQIRRIMRPTDVPDTGKTNQCCLRVCMDTPTALLGYGTLTKDYTHPCRKLQEVLLSESTAHELMTECIVHVP